MTAEEKVRDLCEQYKKNRENLSDQEKVQKEIEIWNALVQVHGTGVTRKVGRRGAWFAEQFGGTCAEYELRLTIYNLGSASQPIWDRLTKDMSLNTAAHIAREAKKKGAPWEDSVKEALKKFDETGSLKTPIAAKNASSYSNEFTRRIKTLTEQYGEEQLKNIDSYLAKKAIDDFVDWVDTGVKDLLYTAQKLRKDARQERMRKVGVTRFNQACEILSFSVPFGKPIDRIEIKKRAHLRAKDLHPDITNNNEAKTREYQAVIEAREILEDYMDQIEGK